MTMQDLADACGLSKAYVARLEKGINPKTGKPVSPTVQTLDSLPKCLDGDQPVTLTTPSKTLSDEQMTILKAYDELNGDGIFGVILNFSSSNILPTWRQYDSEIKKALFGG